MATKVKFDPELLDKGLLELRVTPVNGMTPAERVFGRMVRTLVP